MAISSRLLNDGEHVVVSTRTHPKMLLGPFLVLVVTVAATALLTRLVGETDDGLVRDVLRWLVWGAAVVVLVWFVLRPVLDWLTTTYTFTNRRFIARSGVIAKEGRTIPLNRISGVDFEIGVVDRLFGCGTLIVSDASADGRVEVHDIPRVEETQLKVAQELHRLSGRAEDGA